MKKSTFFFFFQRKFLNFQRVMQRIVKRFLLHKQRESDDVKESDFDELKQDLQMVRFEMLNDIKKSEEETLKYISLIHNGVAILGDEILKDVDDVNLANRFKDFKQFDGDQRDSIETIDNDSTPSERTSFSGSLNDDNNNSYSSLFERSSFKRSMQNLAFNENSLNNTQSISLSDLMINQQHIVNTIFEQSRKISSTELHVINEEDEVSSGDHTVKF
jgi:hypothetical protein